MCDVWAFGLISACVFVFEAKRCERGSKCDKGLFVVYIYIYIYIYIYNGFVIDEFVKK